MRKVIRITDRSSKAFNAYLKKINTKNTEPLTHEEEVELGMRIKQGDISARNRLIETNQRYVITLAKNWLGYNIPLEELVSAGLHGLVIAATRFDPAFDRSFVAYAKHYITEHIRQAIAEYRNPMHIPFSVMRDQHRDAPSVNDDNINYEELLEKLGERRRPVFPIFESLDDDFGEAPEDAYNRPLIERVAAPIDKERLEQALRDTEEELRALLAKHFYPGEVNLLMDYARKYCEDYTIDDLAFEYRLPKEKMSAIIDDLLKRAELLNLKAAFYQAA